MVTRILGVFPLSPSHWQWRLLICSVSTAILIYRTGICLVPGYSTKQQASHSLGLVFSTITVLMH